MSGGGLRWEPIRDYEVDRGSLARPELSRLAAVWRERRAELEDSDAFKAFQERLHREWAIETGLIERIYALDRGVTETLIERGIAADVIARSSGVQRPERVARIIQSQRDALEGLFAFVQGERPLSTSYIKELHAAITRHQETTEAVDDRGHWVEVSLLRGAYKK